MVSREKNQIKSFLCLFNLLFRFNGKLVQQNDKLSTEKAKDPNSKFQMFSVARPLLALFQGKLVVSLHLHSYYGFEDNLTKSQKNTIDNKGFLDRTVGQLQNGHFHSWSTSFAFVSLPLFTRQFSGFSILIDISNEDFSLYGDH